MLTKISLAEIEYAEQILFGSTNHFDQERLDFIHCLHTTDLQAVPGSGKTTVLLAKLLIIEKRLPLDQGSGILILSHTNTAIDEIRHRIGAHCPKLFSYPNFVGTIQSFVNQFLAIPFYENHYGKKVVRIDNELYQEEMNRNLKFCLRKESFEVYKKVLHIRRANPEMITDYRFDLLQGVVSLIKKINGKPLSISKPRGNTKKENYIDYTEAEKADVHSYLKLVKIKCLKEGTLNYDDAYFLAKLYLKKRPNISKYLRLRFPFVFVDEMQDMEKHQHDLLENLFFDVQEIVCYQRIGDINQCIFNENTSVLKGIWTSRVGSLTISGSHRLPPALAKIVQNFGAKKFVPISGLNANSNIKPHLILFNAKEIENVISFFGNLILQYQDTGQIPKTSSYPIKVIGWNGKESESGKLRIGDYYSDYQGQIQKQKIDFMNFYSYLIYYEQETLSFEPIRKNMLNAILRLLRIEKIMNGSRYFRKSTLLAHLRFNQPKWYEMLLTSLYEACINVIRDREEEAHNKLIEFVPGFILEVFGHAMTIEGLTFITDKTLANISHSKESLPNRIIYKSLEMAVGTVHSVKGETHLATLYLDTCYFKHESEKSVNQLIGKDASVETKIRVQDSAKMLYVGFSRATHLMCYAAQLSCLENKEDELRSAGWEVVRLENF